MAGEQHMNQDHFQDLCFDLYDMLSCYVIVCLFVFRLVTLMAAILA